MNALNISFIITMLLYSRLQLSARPVNFALPKITSLTDLWSNRNLKITPEKINQHPVSIYMYVGLTKSFPQPKSNGKVKPLLYIGKRQTEKFAKLFTNRPSEEPYTNLTESNKDGRMTEKMLKVRRVRSADPARTLKKTALVRRREVISVVPIQSADEYGRARAMVTVPLTTLMILVLVAVVLLVLQRLCCTCVRTEDGFKWRIIVCCEDIMEGLLYDGLKETCLNIFWCNVGLEQHYEDIDKTGNENMPGPKKKKKHKKGNTSNSSSRANSVVAENTALTNVCSNASPMYSQRGRSSRVPLVPKPVLPEKEDEKFKAIMERQRLRCEGGGRCCCTTE